jgi:hypothetical protein
VSQAALPVVRLNLSRTWLITTLPHLKRHTRVLQGRKVLLLSVLSLRSEHGLLSIDSGGTRLVLSAV